MPKGSKLYRRKGTGTPIKKCRTKKINSMKRKKIEGTFTAMINVEDVCDETSSMKSGSWLKVLGISNSSETVDGVFESTTDTITGAEDESETSSPERSRSSGEEEESETSSPEKSRSSEVRLHDECNLTNHEDSDGSSTINAEEMYPSPEIFRRSVTEKEYDKLSLGHVRDDLIKSPVKVTEREHDKWSLSHLREDLITSPVKVIEREHDNWSVSHLRKDFITSPVKGPKEQADDFFHSIELTPRIVHQTLPIFADIEEFSPVLPISANRIFRFEYPHVKKTKQKFFQRHNERQGKNFLSSTRIEDSEKPIKLSKPAKDFIKPVERVESETPTILIPKKRLENYFEGIVTSGGSNSSGKNFQSQLVKKRKFFHKRKATEKILEEEISPTVASSVPIQEFIAPTESDIAYSRTSEKYSKTSLKGIATNDAKCTEKSNKSLLIKKKNHGHIRKSKELSGEKIKSTISSFVPIEELKTPTKSDDNSAFSRISENYSGTPIKRIVTNDDQCSEKLHSSLLNKKKNHAHKRKSKQELLGEKKCSLISSVNVEDCIASTESYDINTDISRLSENHSETPVKETANNGGECSEKLVTNQLVKNKNVEHKRKSKEELLTEKISLTGASSVPIEGFIAPIEPDDDDDNKAASSRISENYSKTSVKGISSNDLKNSEKNDRSQLIKRNKHAHKRKSKEESEETMSSTIASSVPIEEFIAPTESDDNNAVLSRISDNYSETSVKGMFSNDLKNSEKHNRSQLIKKKKHAHKRKSKEESRKELEETIRSTIASSVPIEEFIAPTESDDNNAVLSRISDNYSETSVKETVNNGDKCSEKPATNQFVKSKKAAHKRKSKEELLKEKVSLYEASPVPIEEFIAPTESDVNNAASSRTSENHSETSVKGIATNGGKFSKKKPITNQLIKKKKHVPKRKSKKKILARASTALTEDPITRDENDSEQSLTESELVPVKTLRKKVVNQRNSSEESVSTLSSSTTLTQTEYIPDTESDRSDGERSEGSTEEFLEEMGLYESEPSLKKETLKPVKQILIKLPFKGSQKRKTLSKVIEEYKEYLKTIPICELSVQFPVQKQVEDE